MFFGGQNDLCENLSAAKNVLLDFRERVVNQWIKRNR